MGEFALMCTATMPCKHLRCFAKSTEVDNTAETIAQIVSYGV